MSEYVEPKHEAYPSCKLPKDLGGEVWRYMDLKKFEYFLDKKALYLCRADLLQDRFEGTFAREQITDLNQYFQCQGHHILAESEETYRRQIRQQTYISCWCLAESDFDLMWKAYIIESPGVAVKSTVKNLLKIRDELIEYWPLDLSIVTYFNHAGGEHITYDRLAHFHHKDLHFKLDNEIRLIHWPNSQLPSPNHIDLPVRPIELITSVVLQPKSSIKSMMKMRQLMDRYGLMRIPIEYSRDDRELLD